MEVQQYKEIINKTAIFPKEHELSYPILGLIGEFGEFKVALRDMTLYVKQPNKRKNLLKEAGDVLWYITAICKVYGIEATEVIIENGKGKFDWSVTESDIRIAEIAESIKKYLRDDKIDLDKLKENLIFVSDTVRMSSVYNGIMLSEILKTNYEKLIKRRETGTLQGSGDHREEIQQNETT